MRLAIKDIVIMAAQAVLAIGALSIALYIADNWMPRNKEKASETVTAAAGPSPTMVQGKSESLSSVFNFKTLGTQVAYFEKQYGPAYRIEDDHTRIYKIADCDIILGVDGTQIQNVGISLISDRCRVPNDTFFLDFAWPSPTFRDLENIASGTYRSDCLDMCGNGFEPSVFLEIQTGTATNGVQITASTVGFGSAWGDALIRKYGDAYVGAGKFNCDKGNSLQGVASDMMAVMPVQTLRVGYDLFDLEKSSPLCPPQ